MPIQGVLGGDFTPTKETITLHGLGFIQIRLGGNMRMHVWHPELPKRTCFEDSSVHNHRFAFESTVLKGTHHNVRVGIALALEGTHDVISHDGKRLATGNRRSYPVARCNVKVLGQEEFYPGDQYRTAIGEYHCTPNDGIVVTLMRKLEESTIHANSLCVHGTEFDYNFDRFQLTPSELFEYVRDALEYPG